MNISLKKANALQHAITEAIAAIPVPITADINIFQDPSEQLQRANRVLFENDSRRQKLLLAYYNIRGLVGAANAQAGIDINLTKAAFLTQRIRQLEEIANGRPHIDLKVLEGRLDRIRNRPEEPQYGYEDRDSVTTTVMSSEQIKQAKAEINNLKKQRQALNDQTLELNVKTEIPLGEEVVATLTNEGLL